MALVFANHVHESFEFLILKYGFQCASSSEHCVRYENDRVFVNVRYDKERSYELDVEVGQKNVLFNGQERPFNLGEVLRLKEVEAKEQYTFLQASNQQDLVGAIRRLASLLDIYASELLQGDQFAFKALANLREREGRQYALEKELQFIRSDADKAWEAKDYAKMVRLYSPVEQLLTPAEKKKLEYAKKHLQS